MRFTWAFLMILCVIFSCNTQKKSTIDVSKISIDYEIKRFDIDFYTATKETLPNVKVTYPYLFPESFSDSISLEKIADKQEQELFAETQKVYKDFSDIEKQLTSFFKHVKYYNPNFKAPDVVTIQSNIDYENRVIYADSLLLISLDVFLGKNHPFYADFPNYIKQNNTKEHLIVTIAETFINQQIRPTINRSFIAKMVHEGKKIALLDWYLPSISEVEKMGYSKEKWQWAVENEAQIWAYFMEEKLLFSTETNLNKRFLEDAPFSKFYREQDNLSPGKIGVWLGWQIVQSYLKHNDVSLQEFLKKDETELFNQSKYKPKK
ncbi:gliding motility lipoprotein GldB [Polaribacter gangjinensis]|uniref:Gliding motility lipoprotein GldB n=1 Tax=Polaribacter gangjinensis TaxID=574710 RepID=A0A2S7WDU9_9FLAO|nr:gliding motility lipoprotein GldB [Polaribacter gangjinensis]PQJ75799.1 gliding motility lipoprotein GldB [Polaribacter gangjinensis]